MSKDVGHGIEAGKVTGLLAAWRAGDRDALTRLLPLVYDELRVLARQQLRGERHDHTLQPTALVHEAFLRLVDQHRAQWRDRLHFLAVAATAMRRVLVDHARRHGTAKRGRDVVTVPLDEATALAGGRPPDLLALDDGLAALAEIHPEAARLLELRFFGGLTNEEAGTLLGLSVPTVTRRIGVGRAWLFRHLSHDAGADR